MKHRFLFIGLVFIFILIPMVSFAGIAYYVDPDSPKGGNGSFANPWNSIAEVNQYSFETGDGLYFRAGTRLIMTQPLNIRWSGTAENRAVIGSYYGENQFGLGSGQRPILDGQSNTVPTQGSYLGLIYHRNRAGYVTIENLEIRDSGGEGISIGNPGADYNYPHINTYNIIRNCLIHRSWRRGIGVVRSSHNLIENNYLFETSHGRFKAEYSVGGAAIEVSSMNREGLTNYNMVRGNVINRCHEGVGIYQRARYTTVELNTVYDCRTYYIYLDKVRDSIIRNNLVYATTNSIAYPHRGSGIVMHAETQEYGYEAPIGWHQVYNNFIAGMANGINIGLTEGSTVGHRGLRIYGNRLVDNANNFRFSRDDQGFWSDNLIEKNFSFIYSDPSTLKHTNKYNPISFHWDDNYFNSLPSVAGKASNGAHINLASLRKTEGWRELQAGKVDKTFFSLVEEEKFFKISPNQGFGEAPKKVVNFGIHLN